MLCYRCSLREGNCVEIPEEFGRFIFINNINILERKGTHHEISNCCHTLLKIITFRDRKIL